MLLNGGLPLLLFMALPASLLVTPIRSFRSDDYDFDFFAPAVARRALRRHSPFQAKINAARLLNDRFKQAIKLGGRSGGGRAQVQPSSPLASQLSEPDGGLLSEGHGEREACIATDLDLFICSNFSS